IGHAKLTEGADAKRDAEDSATFTRTRSERSTARRIFLHLAAGSARGCSDNALISFDFHFSGANYASLNWLRRRRPSGFEWPDPGRNTTSLTKHLGGSIMNRPHSLQAFVVTLLAAFSLTAQAWDRGTATTFATLPP